MTKRTMMTIVQVQVVEEAAVRDLVRQIVETHAREMLFGNHRFAVEPHVKALVITRVQPLAIQHLLHMVKIMDVLGVLLNAIMVVPHAQVLVQDRVEEVVALRLANLAVQVRVILVAE